MPAKLLEQTIDAMILDRPEPDEVEQYLCLDKGYDNPAGQAAVLNAEYVPTCVGLARRSSTNKRKRHPARRWVVERTASWLNRCRGILVRYAKKPSSYLDLKQASSR